MSHHTSPIRSTLNVAAALLVMITGLTAAAPESGHAQDPGLLAFGTRFGLGGNSFLGEEQKENFEQYDVAATFALPWHYRDPSGWSLESRFIASAGELRAAGAASFMGTLVPAVAFTAFDGAVTLDLGVGAGIFSRYKFGVQNFGGPVQIIGTTGVGVALPGRLFAGYRFQHFSDATLYGDDSLGADIHIMELSYRF